MKQRNIEIKEKSAMHRNNKIEKKEYRSSINASANHLNVDGE